MIKKNILITAGGTATAWHLVNVINEHFKDKFNVFISDTNPKHLVASALLAEEFFQVPSVFMEDYYQSMLLLLRSNNIDIIVPLIDFDLDFFPRDNHDLINMGIFSTAPSLLTLKTLENKSIASDFMSVHGIAVPLTFTSDTVEKEVKYLVKPLKGFGSRGVSVLLGHDITILENLESYLIQELCYAPEITVEIFNFKGEILTLCRERVETKSGVATKAKFFYDEEINLIIKKLSIIVELPTASCIQFMKNIDNKWVITDVNLRLGAGSSMSSRVGWNLTAASLCSWGNFDINPFQFLNEVPNGSYVVRVYSDILTL